MLPKELCQLLRKYIKERKITSGSVFITRKGQPIDRHSIWKAMKQLCESAGVSKEKVFPHNLRHLFARTYYTLQNHVLYRVTPIFEGDNLLASGVLMEGWSVEDNGEGICYNVFCYNVQPGIIIDYSNGDSKAKDGSKPYGSSDKSNPSSKQNSTGTTTYIANKNTKKFHYPYCGSVGQMKDKNKKPLTCTRDEAIRQGYSPCGNCIGK